MLGQNNWQHSLLIDTHYLSTDNKLYIATQSNQQQQAYKRNCQPISCTVHIPVKNLIFDPYINTQTLR